MRGGPWTLAVAASLVVAAAAGGVVALSGGNGANSAAQEPPPSTATVEKGKLSSMVSLDGTLTHRARVDGSPYVVTNQASGTYTKLPQNGDAIDCGGVLYRVDDHPVLLLCGTIPAYRSLSTGGTGRDVRQLNQNLHRLGYDADAGVHIDRDEDAFGGSTAQALKALQRDKGLDATGAIDLDDAVYLPSAVRIAKVTGTLGGPARPGTPVAQATSDTLQVQVSLDPAQQDQVRKRDRAQITLPDNTAVTGGVARVGRVALAAGQNSDGPATIPAYISLDHPARADRFDQAPVRVDITTHGVDSALSVPVTAIVGKSGGGFAVEVARSNGVRELVAVRLGLFDPTAGRVQVDGDLREGDAVVVPSP